MSEFEGQVPQEAVEPEAEVTEKEFEGASEQVEAKGVTPEMPGYKAELHAQFQQDVDKMRKGEDANPSEWGSHESVN